MTERLEYTFGMCQQCNRAKRVLHWTGEQYLCRTCDPEELFMTEPGLAALTRAFWKGFCIAAFMVVLIIAIAVLVI